jgi:hypothetical protein
MMHSLPWNPFITPEILMEIALGWIDRLEEEHGQDGDA